jgi:hypothetical protein
MLTEVNLNPWRESNYDNVTYSYPYCRNRIRFSAHLAKLIDEWVVFVALFYLHYFKKQDGCHLPLITSTNPG